MYGVIQGHRHVLPMILSQEGCLVIYSYSLEPLRRVLPIHVKKRLFHVRPVELYIEGILVSVIFLIVRPAGSRLKG